MPAARDVAAGAFHRHREVAGLSARDRDRQVGKSRALCVREACDPRGHAFQAVAILAPQGAERVLERLAVEHQRVLTPPLTELFGEQTQRGFTALANPIDDLPRAPERIRRELAVA
jgi:hypothetical protein